MFVDEETSSLYAQYKLSLTAAIKTRHRVILESHASNERF